jgi:hypothetical protein
LSLWRKYIFFLHWIRAAVPKGDCIAPGDGEITEGTAKRQNGSRGASEMGSAGRFFCHLFTIEMTLNQTLENWYPFIRSIRRIKNLRTVKYREHFYFVDWFHGSAFHGDRNAACREAQMRWSAKLIIYLNSKRYRPSGMLIHRQNSYAYRSRRCTGRREAQSREPVNRVKKNSIFTKCFVLVYCYCLP